MELKLSHVCTKQPINMEAIIITGASSGAGRAMVAAAKKPAANTYVGSVSYLLKFAHTLAPELMTKSTAFVMRRYLKNAKSIEPTSGNLYNIADYGMTVNGGFGLPGEPKAHRKYLLGALVAAFAAEFFIINKKHT